MSNVRIVKKTYPDKRTEFVIQQRHFLFRWWWVDAWINSDVYCVDYFKTLDEAKNSLCYFDGTQTIEEIVE